MELTVNSDNNASHFVYAKNKEKTIEIINNRGSYDIKLTKNGLQKEYSVGKGGQLTTADDSEKTSFKGRLLSPPTVIREDSKDKHSRIWNLPVEYLTTGERLKATFLRTFSKKDPGKRGEINHIERNALKIVDELLRMLVIEKKATKKVVDKVKNIRERIYKASLK